MQVSKVVLSTCLGLGVLGVLVVLLILIRKPMPGEPSIFRYSVRELVGLLVIAMLCCLAGSKLAPADPISQLILAGCLFVFGGGCYVGGIAAARTATLNRP